jgi:cold shock CspA family protein
MNGFGGRIKRIHRSLGVGTIEPSDGGPEVIFTDDAVKGGQDGFRNLKEGDPVKYRPYPAEIADRQFADDVWPDVW